jgi:pimeloyl-ACP methyl ester carboxylesterase
LKQPALFITGSLDPVNFFNGVGYKDTDDIKNTIGSYYENLIDIQMIEDAGHWVQQEKPEEVNKHLLNFLEKIT